MFGIFNHLLLELMHLLQLLMELLGKWRTKCQRESNRVSFKAVCGCVIESWSSCACLTHWLMAGCLDSLVHTLTHARMHTHTVKSWHTRGAPPLTFLFIILLSSSPCFCSTSSPVTLLPLFHHSFSSSLRSLFNTLPPFPLTVKVHRPSTILHSMSHV